MCRYNLKECYKRLSIFLIMLLCGLLFNVAAPAIAQEADTPQLAPLNPEFIQFMQARALRIQTLTATEEGHALGYIPPPVDLSHMTGVQALQFQMLAAPLTAVATYDLRSTGKLTPVKDQGSCGDCWAFAAMGSLESFLMPSETWDFSENNLKNIHGFDFGPCVGGNGFMSMAYFARWDGPIRESDDPYNPYPPYSSPTGLTVQKHLQEVLIIPSGANDYIKQAVMTYGAVQTTMYWSDFYYNSANKAYYYNSAVPANHAVDIVGWDDNYSSSNFNTAPPGNGAFIIRNSWGTGWGMSGYFYLSYYDSLVGKNNYVFKGAQTATNYRNIYEYDPLGWVNNYGYNSNTAWFANVFTAEANEQLSAVSFYTASPNSSYTVYVYSNVSSGPTSGTLAGSTSGTILAAGYHTITLPSNIPLTLGQKFSAVVQLTTPGFDFPITIEYPETDYSSHATANAGQSYISNSGTIWSDMTTKLANANVCLKAFTVNDNPGTIQLSSATYSVMENAGTATITATRTGGSYGEVGVSYATSDGTATAGSDYTTAIGALSWADGDAANKTFTVEITNDMLYGPNKTFTVTLSSATGGATIGTPGSATVTIMDYNPPPTGSVLINSGDGWTKSAAVTLTLTATDDNLPIQMCISNTTTCATWTAFASPKPWTLTTGNGTKTVNVWFKDSLGNTTPVGIPFTDTIGLDTTAPVNGTVTATPGAGQIVLNWSGFTDTLSGIAGYKVVYAKTTAPTSCATGTVLYNGTSLTYTHTGLINQTYGYRVCGIDNAGNISTGVTKTSKPMKAESNPPANGSITINNGSAWTKSATVTLALAATDESGITQYCISNTGTCTTWTTISSTTSLSITKTWTLLTGNGSKTVNVWFKDTWGTITPAPYTDAIGLDTTVPINGTMTATPEAGQIVLNWSGFTDALSGISSYKVVYAKGTAPTSCATGTVLYNGSSLTYTHTGLINQTYGYRVCAIDNAGNISTGVTKTSKPMKAESNPPANGSITINNGAAWTKSATVTLALAATDESGITQYCISNTGTCTAWTTISSTTNLSITKTWTLLTGNGSKTVNVWFKDTWGTQTPVGTPITDTIGLDTTAPINGALTATPGSGQIALSWAGFNDTLSGIGSYKLVFSTTGTPTSCSTGAVLYSNGLNTTYSHNGLNSSLTYYYRVCAVNGAGSISTGATKSAKPLL